MPTNTTLGSYQPSQDPTRRDVRYIYDTIREWADSVSSSQIIHGVLIKDVVVGVAPQRIFHSLGRRPVGVVVAISSVPIMLAVTERDEKTITVQASSDCTVSLWVF